MGNLQPSIDNAEHIGPSTTGDNVEAKRAAHYGFGADSNWSRFPLPVIDLPYDSMIGSNPDANGNNQTLTFKNGTATVRTLTLTFDSSSNVTSLVRT